MSLHEALQMIIRGQFALPKYRMTSNLRQTLRLRETTTKKKKIYVKKLDNFMAVVQQTVFEILHGRTDQCCGCKDSVFVQRQR